MFVIVGGTVLKPSCVSFPLTIFPCTGLDIVPIIGVEVAFNGFAVVVQDLECFPYPGETIVEVIIVRDGHGAEDGKQPIFVNDLADGDSD
jgi:hypothetical protein